MQVKNPDLHYLWLQSMVTSLAREIVWTHRHPSSLASHQPSDSRASPGSPGRADDRRYIGLRPDRAVLALCVLDRGCNFLLGAFACHYCVSFYSAYYFRAATTAWKGNDEIGLTEYETGVFIVGPDDRRHGARSCYWPALTPGSKKRRDASGRNTILTHKICAHFEQPETFLL